jgi:hypothetical protein
MYINCPVCGTKNQDNRETCWKCSSNLFGEAPAGNSGSPFVKKEGQTAIKNQKERLLLNDLIRGMSKEEVEQLMLHAYEFRKAIMNDMSEAVKARAKAFYILINNMEMKTGVRIFKDKADIAGLMFTFSTILVQLLNQIVEARKPKPGSKSFGSVSAANFFLRQNKNIIVKTFKVNTRSSFGLLANHAYADSIYITYDEYPEPVNYEYGMCEEETKNWFIMRGEDYSFKHKWESSNRGLECVAYTTTSNARGTAGSLLFGFGNVIENVTYFVLYRRKLAGAQ